MEPRERVKICLILEKARENKDYAQKVGIEDRTKKGGK